MANYRKELRRLWHFIWEDDGIWSWIVNVILAFVLIKFIVYPGLGFLLNTTHPVVAVVSESMEHKGYPKCVQKQDYCTKYQYEICGKLFDGKVSFKADDFWNECGSWYAANSEITKEQFLNFPLRNGFNKGDIIILKGKLPEKINVGDIIVFWSPKKDPIIHRVIKKWEEAGTYYFQTKGDHNPGMIKTTFLDETKISEEQLIGYAYFRIPMLGFIKIWFVELIDFARALL